MSLLQLPEVSEARRSFWIAVAILFGCLIGVGIYAWIMLRDSGISLAGAIALGLGILITLGLGVGLMSLVFFSSRAGFDRRAGGEEHRRAGLDIKKMP